MRNRRSDVFPSNARLAAVMAHCLALSAGCDDCGHATRLGYVNTVEPLVISEMSPTVGHAAAVVPVVIRGEHFLARSFQDVNELGGVGYDDVFQAWLGEVPLRQVRLVDETTLTAEVPEGIPPGRYTLTVRSPFEHEATLADAYFASSHGPPEITGFSPEDLVSDAATPAAVLGSAFRPGAEVFLVDADAARFPLAVTAVNDERIEVTVPPDLAPGVYAVMVQNDDRQMGSLSDAAVVHGAPVLTTTILPTAGAVVVGQQQHVRVVVRNDGDSPVEGVALDLDLADQGGFDLDGSVTPADVRLVAGAEVELALPLVATAAGTVTLRATAVAVSEHGGREVRSGTAETDPVLVYAPALLSAEVLVTPAVASVGSALSVVVRVRNTGGADALDVEPGSPVVSPSQLATLTASPDNAPVTIPAGGQADFVFAYVAASVDTGTFTAGAAGTEAHSARAVQAPSSSSPPVEVQSAAALQGQLAVTPEVLGVGQQGTVALTVANGGGTAANGVTPTLTLPAGLDLVSGPTPATADIEGEQSGVFSWVVVATAPGAQSVSASAAGTDSISNVPVTAAADVVNVTVVDAVALSAGWTTPDVVSFGQSFSAALQVTNTGGSEALDVTPLAFTVEGGTLTACGSPTPATRAIPAGATRSFTYACTAGSSAGTAVLRAEVEGTDGATQQPVRAGPFSSSGTVVEAAVALALQWFTVLGSTGSTCGTPAPSTATIAGGAQQTFVYDCAAGTTSGTVSVSAGAAGTESNSGTSVSAAAATSGTASVTSPPDLSAGFTVGVTAASYGQSFLLTLTVANAGETNALGVVPTGFDVAGGTGVTCGAPSPTSADIAAFDSEDFLYTCAAAGPSGDASFSAAADGQDENDGATISALSTTSAAVTIESAASLLASWQTVPTSLTRGQSFTATLRVENDGEAAALAVAPSSATLSGTTGTTCGTPSTTSTTIAGGSSFDFDYPCTAGATSETFTLTSNAAGSDENSSDAVTAAAATSAGVAVQSAPFLALTWTVPSFAGLSSAFDVELLVVNSGEATAAAVSPYDFALNGPAGVLCGPPSPASSDIAGSGQIVFTFGCTSGTNSGLADVTAGAAGVDDNTSAAVSAAPLTSRSIALSDNVAVRINEVVTDPQRDWNDTADGNGVAYDYVPGTGTIDDGDQWLELYNDSDVPLDLSGYVLAFSNEGGTSGAFTFGDAGDGQTVLFLGGGSMTAWGPGERVLIGQPAGAGAMSDDVYLTVTSEAGVLLDDVATGNSLGGDGDASNNAPSGVASGVNEAVARVPDGNDTGSESSDFSLVESTIGRDNDCPSRSTLAYAAASSGSGTGATLTFSHSTSGSDRFLFVSTSTATQAVSSVTYGGVPLTRIRTAAEGSARVEMWGLAHPAAGANSVVVTFPAATSAAAGAISVTGAQQSFAFDNSASATGDTGVLGGNQPSVGISTSTANAWVLGALAFASGETANAGAGQLRRWHVNSVIGSAGSTRGPLASPGATTSSWTNLGILQPWAAGAVSVRGQCQ